MNTNAIDTEKTTTPESRARPAKAKRTATKRAKPPKKGRRSKNRPPNPKQTAPTRKPK